MKKCSGECRQQSDHLDMLLVPKGHSNCIHSASGGNTDGKCARDDSVNYVVIIPACMRVSSPYVQYRRAT